MIEDLKTALARGAKIYAEIIGTCINSGGMRFGGSMTAPSDKGVQRCVQMAVSDAEIAPKDIDYYNGHLTATYADSKEIYNWAHALKLEPEQFPLVNATKSLIGHTLGAAGGIECVATLLQLDQGFVHGSKNCEDLHPKLEPFRNRIVMTTREVDFNIAAKASFGFGDVNSCIIFQKWENK